MLEKHQKQLSTYNPNLKINERFIGGMSNYTYLATNISTGEKFVFRTPGEGGSNFVDYNLEAKNIKLVDSLNINSQTVTLDPSAGVKIAKYIPGSMADDTIDLNLVATTLKTLHTSDVQLPDYVHLDRLEKYAAIHNNKGIARYEELKQFFADFYQKELKQHVIYPCHNDAQVANFILSDFDQLFLLDWEFAGTNDFIYDIASFGNKDFKMALNLLETYLVNPTKDDYIRLYAWRLFQCLQWHNVASYKHEIGLSTKLQVHLEFVAQNYINLADQMYQEIIKLQTP